MAASLSSAPVAAPPHGRRFPAWKGRGAARNWNSDPAAAPRTDTRPDGSVRVRAAAEAPPVPVTDTRDSVKLEPPPAGEGKFPAEQPPACPVAK